MTETTVTTVTTDTTDTNVTETVELPATTETKAPKAKDFTSYAAKAPTSLHKHYAEWLTEKTGIDFSAVKPEDMVKIVQLSVVLYHDYQASDENKARKAAEAAGKAPKQESKVKAELTAAQQEIENLKAQLAAATATPATKAPARKAPTKTAAK